MAKRKGLKVKTKVGDLKWVFIKGEGRNNAMSGEEPRMQYVASLECDTDGPVHKHFHDLVYKEWEAYKADFGLKGKPGKNKHGEYMDGMHPVLVDDENGVEDPDTGKVKKVKNGKTLITFKTNTTWPDGNPQVVKVFDGKGAEITEFYKNADWYLGEGSTGIIHGSAVGNNAGDAHKVTLYLSAVQIAKLVKGEGDAPDTEEIEGAEDIDMEDGCSAIDSDQEPEV